MRAAAGVTAFSSQSDLNLLDACFVRFSHTKGNIFPYFLCVSFLSTFPCRIKSSHIGFLYGLYGLNLSHYLWQGVLF